MRDSTARHRSRRPATALALALATMIAGAGPAGAQALLPLQPRAGLDLRVWLWGEEPAAVNLALQFGDLEPCRIDGRFDPALHRNAAGFVHAASNCGLTLAQRRHVAAADGTATLRLIGKVRMDSGWTLTIDQTRQVDLDGVADAQIEFSRATGILFNPAQG